MARQIALLRGINIRSRRRVDMPALRELLGGLGYEDMRTYLQSGNVVLSSPKRPRQLEAELERQIASGLGVEVQVLVRTRNELADVIERNPLADVADNPKRYQVSFLSERLAARVERELVAADVSPEQLVVSGREIYVWHAEGIQRSAAAKLLSDRRLGVTSTARNWNTVTKLLELADE